MKLDSFRRLNKNDYDEEFQQLVGQLADSLNIGIENIYLALNKRLTRTDNLLSTEKDLEFSVDGDGIPTSPLFFDLDFTGKAKGLVIERTDNLSNQNAYPTSGVSPTWVQSGNRITIQHITGLRSASNYRIHVVVNG